MNEVKIESIRFVNNALLFSVNVISGDHFLTLLVEIPRSGVKFIQE